MHRRGGEQQQELPRQRVDRLPGLRLAVAQVMRLIDDQQVPVDLSGDGHLRRLFQRVEAGHHPGVLLPKLLRVVPRRQLIGRDRRQTKFIVQLLFPLVHQRRDGQHQVPLDHAPRQQFLEHQPGFDGFAQPHFV